MDTRINTQFQPTTLQPNTNTDTETAREQGEFHGQTVTQEHHDPDLLSELQDAAEELTFEHSETVEKNLTEFHISAHEPMTTHAVEKAEMYMQRMQEAENLDKASEFLNRLEHMNHPSADDVLGEVKHFFDEPGEQDAALGFTAELLRGRGGDHAELLETLVQARAQLREGLREDTAGLEKTDERDANWQPDENTQRELQEFHEQSLGGFGNVVDAYNSLTERYGKDHFQDALGFLIRTTGSEMQSSEMNVSGEKLKSMVDDLFHVQVLGNVNASLGQLGEKMEKQFGIALKMPPTEMMKAVLSLTQNAYSRGDQVAAIAKEAGISDTEASIYFLTALKDHLRLIPLKIFPNPDNRAKLLDAAQEALDKAIEKENA